MLPTEPLRTGWPPGMLQDDSRELSQWFASRAGAWSLAADAGKRIKERVMGTMELESAPPTRGHCQRADHSDQCCCNCRHHIRDHHHCTTVLLRPMGKCVCSQPKGWICMPPELGVAYSGWTEHGLCKMWEAARPARKKAPGMAIGGHARAISLTPARRREITVVAAKARWAK